MLNRNTPRLAGLLLLGCLPSGWLETADWPCYQRDAGRSGATEEKLDFPLALHWVHKPPQAPRPAWPEPGREMHRIDFDYAYQPVVASGLVYYGSSADDTLRALDSATGEVKWRFITAGPIRFAPHIAKGKCYVASDDGTAYCLEATSGKLVWQFRAAPQDRRLLGNGRMISRWPCRSGVLVLDDVAYVTAGMWPSEGIHVYALDAGTGKVLWINDTSGTRYMPYPHGGAYALGGVPPQGYLLAAKEILLVATGRSVPAGFDRRTGKFLYYEPAINKRHGGCWATTVGDHFFTPSHTGAWNEHIMIGQSGPRDGDGMLAFELATGKLGWGLGNRHRVVADDQTLYAIGGGAVEALNLKDGQLGELKWSAEHPRVWSAARSGNALLVGGTGTLTGFNTADGTTIWQGETDGQVWGLAIAGGRVIAATDRGTIYSFGPGRPGGAQKSGTTSSTSLKLGVKTAPRQDTHEIIDRIRRTGFTKGFALIVGAADARLAETIADQTELHAICALRDEAQVATERERLLGRGEVYGAKVAVQHVPDFARLPFAQFFANVVVVSGNAAEMSGKELYRVLRPCGGLMLFAAMDRKGTRKLIREADLLWGEARPAWRSKEVVRGKLPGAFDWDSRVKADRRIKWPLELLWAGGPGPDRMVNRHWKPPTSVAANGRTFVLGEYHIIAIDSYNGTELWAREIGNLFGSQTTVAADDDSVYVNFADHCLRLDAQTGRIRKLYGRRAPSRCLSLESAQALKVTVDETHSGTITIGNTGTGLELTLETKDPAVTGRDSWSLYFDFRPSSERTVVYGEGAFQGTVVPVPDQDTGNALWRVGVGPAHPEPVLKREAVEGGTRVTFGLTWQQVRSLTGSVPRDFSFMATLNSHDGGQGSTLKSHLFDSGAAGILNYGWGTFVLDGAGLGQETTAAPLAYGRLSHLPTHARKPGRQPQRARPDAELLTREQPLVNRTGPRVYRRAYGCGGIISSETMDFFRSGTVGFYDLAEDSGLRNFAGIKVGCGVSIVPAAGVLVSPESSAGCSCSYSFQTSFALAPATTRRNEDWAVFFDQPEYGFVQSASLNLGAPGDRRDDGGMPWLGIPRPQSDLNVPAGRRVDFHVPFSFIAPEGFGSYRTNADRVTIAETDRPWLYTSGIRGLQRATLDMEYLESGLASLPAEKPPVIDARLDDACWDLAKLVSIHEPKARMMLRHDEDSLYVAYQRPATIDRHGTVTPWVAATKGSDAPVWEDDSLELFISDADTKRCLHLGVSASGAKYDALWVYEAPAFPTFDIPRLEGIAIDGKAGDWGTKGTVIQSMTGVQRKMRATENFDPSFRLGWNDEGLLLLVKVSDNAIKEAAKAEQLWMGDGIELLLSPVRNRREFYQMAVGTGADPEHPGTRTFFWDRRKETAGEELTSKAAGHKTDSGYLVEVLMPWKNVKLTPAPGVELGLQAFVNDIDGGVYPDGWFRSLWHPGGHAGFQDPNAFHHLRLATEPSKPLVYKRDATADENGLFTAAPPYPFTFEVSSLGAKGEDSQYSGPWSSAVQLTGEDVPTFTAELAIPWEVLAQAGLSRERLIMNLHARAPLTAAPRAGGRYERLNVSVGKDIPSRLFTVRLHFAELDEVDAGTRVFDVKLQGKTVLRDFDVVSAAGGTNRALVREFSDVVAARTLSVELIPKATVVTDATAPILSAIEIVEER